MERRWPTVLRGLLAALALLALVVGVPILLVREVGWPLPTAIPSWERVSQTIATGAIEDATIIKALAVVVWIAWANFASGVLVEAIAVARGRVARRMAGLAASQHLAANILATISVAVTLLARPTATASATPGDLRLAVADAASEHPRVLTDPTVLEPSGMRIAMTDPAPACGAVGDGNRAVGDAAATSLYEVRRGDTLWELADRLLGGGMRWRDIRDLNVGRTQPDGSTLFAGTEELRPGWTLLVPGGISSNTPSESSQSSEFSEDDVVVEHGDTLWALADEHLDDAYRWPEIYEENRGDPQPDGGSLTDPDLIQPGWVLNLPAPGGAQDPGTGKAGEEPPARSEQGEASAAPQPEHAGDVMGDTNAVPRPERDLDREQEDVAPTPAPTAGTRPVPTPQHEPIEQGQPSRSQQADDIALIPIAAAGSIAAGLVLTLDRIRRARLRRRQPHHRIPLPTGAAATAEQRLRAYADPDADRLLNLALRELSGHCAVHRPGSRVLLVSHSSADVAVHLDLASQVSPDAWERRDGDRTWIRPRPTDLDELAVHLGTPSRFPALVTAGTLSGGRVGLLNLAHVGCLHLDGEEDMAQRLMAAWALELATTVRADALDVVAIGVVGLPDGLERLTTLGDVDELHEVLGRSHPIGDTSIPRTVILAAGLPAEMSTLLRTTSELRGGIVAVVSGLVPRSGDWSLHLVDGSARLDPERVAFDLLDLGPEAAPMTARLIEQALHDPEQLVQLPPEDEREAGHFVEPSGEPVADVVLEAPEEVPATEVRVLGPVEIVGTVEPFRTNKTIELIVYLALHRNGADADTLLEALWPDQDPRPARLYTEASRARKSLGTASDGSPHFPDAELGRYRLAESVASDYDRFSTAVVASRRDPAGAIDHLTHALMLVRGVPLSGTVTEYAWATNELYTLAQEVVDAAHDLAQRCLATERYDDAIWAAERGLLADPLSEILVRDLMEAASTTGNTVRVHAAMRRLRRQMTTDDDANDADDWLDPETVSTFERLTRARA